MRWIVILSAAQLCAVVTALTMQLCLSFNLVSFAGTDVLPVGVPDAGEGVDPVPSGVAKYCKFILNNI